MLSDVKFIVNRSIIENGKKDIIKKIGCLVFFILLAVLIMWLRSCYNSYSERVEKEAKRTYHGSYEKACEHNDFAVAHELLAKLKDRAYSSKRRYTNYKVERKEKKHWFKDDEEIIDQKSLEEKESLKEEMEHRALEYLTAFEYIYNAEITFLTASDLEDKKPRIENLLREMKAQLIWFKESSLSDQADEFYNRIKDYKNQNDSIPKL